MALTIDDWSSLINAGATIYSATQAKGAAGAAASAQQGGIDAATAEQQRQFDVTQRNLAPFQSAGAAALDQQRRLLGLGGYQGTPEGLQALDQQITDVRDRGPQAPPVTLQLGGAVQAPSPTIGQDLQNFYANQVEDPELQPLLDQRTALMSQEAPSAQDQQAAAFAALDVSPGQKFLRDRAQKNLLRNSAAIGGLGGGNVRSALVQQGVGFAQQDLENQFSRLGQLAGQGQAATTQVGQFGQQNAANIGNLAVSGADARASGILNRNTAIQQGLGGLANIGGQFLQRQGQSQVGMQNPNSQSQQFFNQNQGLGQQQLGVNTSAGSFAPTNFTLGSRAF